MKKTTLLLMILALTSFACRQKKSVDTSDTSGNPVMVEMSITGMSCMGCVETVRYSVASIDGIDTVSVSLENANALVTFKPQQTDTAAIRKAIELNGYKVTATRPVDGTH